MKYVLIKELPKANIGNEVRINSDLLTEYQTDYGNWILINISVPELKQLGWVKDVK